MEFRMTFSSACKMTLAGLALCTASVAAFAEQPPPKPEAGDPSALSGDFWGDWKKTSTSKSFVALTAAVGTAGKSAAALAAPNTANTQRVVNLAVGKPEDAAKLLSTAAAASNDTASANALKTVVNMVTSPKTREEAAAFVAPEAQASVEAWNADLSSGVQGLPGIYLGDNADNGGARDAAPAGYTPVAGGSMGCATRQ
jgi:hypothetical protein